MELLVAAEKNQGREVEVEVCEKKRVRSLSKLARSTVMVTDVQVLKSQSGEVYIMASVLRLTLVIHVLLILHV